MNEVRDKIQRLYVLASELDAERRRSRILERALAWYADWSSSISLGVHCHATEDGEEVPDMGRRAYDALHGTDVEAEGYEESIEPSQLAIWRDNAEEAPPPYFDLEAARAEAVERLIAQEADRG